MSFQYFQIMIGTGSCIHVNHVYHQHGPSTPISRTCQISTRFLCTCTRRWRVSCILTIRCSPNTSFAPTACLQEAERNREKPRETERNREEDSVLNGCQVPAYVVKFQEKLKQYNQSIWALNRAQSLVARSSIKFLPKK